MKYQRGFIMPGIGQLAIIAIIVALIFGTKKLVMIGKDVGGMFKGVKDGFREATSAADELAPDVREAINDVKRLHAHVAPFKTNPGERWPAAYEGRDDEDTH